ncbi:MAG: YjgP/YjgQ family permease [Bacteroidaceae bacterium]|mgnify:FL=1|nr:YjgP/YjgQ family permease [Bacteroidaceae bacterium]
MIIKKIDIFVLKAFFQLFCGTFFISLFIFMMQFMWRYVEELVGKGLSLWVLAQFFYYAALTLVPVSLPLGVLLASLITFGNLAEKLELLSMKAAGIPLVRIITPIFFFVIALCCWSFYFQNYAAPNATKQLAGLLWGMRQKNPEMEIPEGSFYNDIPGYNLYVERKNKVSGHLYNVMIYSNTDGYEDAQIVMADSAHIQSTADQMHLKLTLWGGERFQNMQNQGGMGRKANVPYMRESFLEEIDMIAFDNNFSALDASLFSGNAQAKNLNEIQLTVDSLNHRMDSIGRNVYSMQLNSEVMARGEEKLHKDSTALVALAARLPSFDSLSAAVPENLRASVLSGALRRVTSCRGEYEFRSMVNDEDAYQCRRHTMEWHKKFTASLCCLIFFFIGAPLGAIIKKGGLGLPVVVSVIIFIFYYSINVAGEKMAKTGDWIVWFGMWMSTFVLTPIAVWLTYKANRDSALFNKDAYLLFLEKIYLRAKQSRLVAYLESKNIITLKRLKTIIEQQ